MLYIRTILRLFAVCFKTDMDERVLLYKCGLGRLFSDGFLCEIIMIFFLFFYYLGRS